MATGKEQDACALLDEPNSYGMIWTPTRLQQTVAAAFSPGCRFRSRHPAGIRWTNPDHMCETARADVSLQSDGSGYLLNYDLPLNGEWSDLTAQFEFNRRQGGYAIVLHDLHVL